VAVEIAKYENAFVNLKGYAEKKSIVVLTDNWHPNWKALLNGKPVEVLKINGAFRGIIVNNGEFDIQLQYEPKTLKPALYLTLLSLLTLFYLLMKKPHRSYTYT